MALQFSTKLAQFSKLQIYQLEIQVGMGEVSIFRALSANNFKFEGKFIQFLIIFQFHHLL